MIVLSTNDLAHQRGVVVVQKKKGLMTELVELKQDMRSREEEMAKAIQHRDELNLEYHRKLWALDMKIFELNDKRDFHDGLFVDLETKISDADTTKSIIDYALRTSVEKPFAVWSIGQVAEFLKLQSRSQVESLGQEQCLHVLRKMFNMGYEENPAAVVDVIRFGCDLVPELHNRICFLLELDDREVSDDVPVDHAATILQLEQEVQQLKKRARHS
jgi:hypothetical protein